MQKRMRALSNVLCLVLLLMTGLFLLRLNSPLYQQIGADNAIFLSIGRGMTQGMIPYVDLTENKGPLFFLLMALPQMVFPGTTGVFLLEEMMLVASCILIAKCAKWLMSDQNWAFPAVTGCAVFVLLHNGGSSCEEYDLFFLLIGIAVMIHMLTAQQRGKGWRAFWLGAAFSAVALIKLSDLPGLLVTVAFYFACLPSQKNRVRREVAVFAIGILVISIPVVLYLFSVNALGPMIKEYLINNFIHVAKGKNAGFLSSRMGLFFSSYGRKALWMLASIVGALGMYFLLEDREKTRLLYRYAVLLALANYAVAFVASSGFVQHLTMGRATCVLAVLLAMHAILSKAVNLPYFRKIQTYAAVAVICVAAGAMLVQVKPEEWVTGEAYQEHIEYQQELAPELEDYRDSVYSIGVYPPWYWENDLFPAYRYYNIIGFIADNVGIDQAQTFEEWLINSDLQALVVEGDLEEYRDVLTNATIDFIYENFLLHTWDSAETRQLLIRL